MKLIKPLFILTLFAILAVLVMSSTSCATTYYVDATSGNDDNNGTSELASWKTITKVNSSMFNPGDQILFKRGRTWREQLTVPSSGTSGNPIIFGAYGYGANPVINASNLVISWSAFSTNVWQAAVSTHPYVVMFNGNQYGYQQPSVDQLSNNYCWFWSAGILYIYSPSNPSSHYASIEAAKRNIGISTNGKSYLNFNSLEIRNSNHYGFYFVGNQSHNILTNMVVMNSRLYNYTPQAGNTITDILLEDCYSSHAGGHGYTLTNQQRWTLRRCSIAIVIA